MAGEGAEEGKAAEPSSHEGAGSHSEDSAAGGGGAQGSVSSVGHEPSKESVGGQSVQSQGHGGGGVVGGGGGEGQMKELQKGLSEEALRIAQLLSVSPDVVNISVNVGFNTKVAVDEILELRTANAQLREENRRLRVLAGEDVETGSNSTPLEQLKKMKAKELLNLVQVTEARVKELELENARTRLQMTFMPERAHGPGHGGKPWAA